MAQTFGNKRSDAKKIEKAEKKALKQKEKQATKVK